MPNTIFVKEKTSRKVTSVQYDSLVDELKQHPKGFVGVEVPSGGNPQHYYYQAVGSEIQRYPLRKLGETYSCMRGYSCLLENKEENETFFGTLKEASSPPALPDGCLFFTPDDRPAIQNIIEEERTDKLKAKEEVPYFPDLQLTKAQQEFLYQGPVLKGNIIFQTELSEILNHKQLSIDEKEAILKACISKERIQLSGESEVLARALQECFLTIGKIINYPVDILSSKDLTEGKETPPSLGAIQRFYVQCIQSHLQKPLEKEALNLFSPMTALMPLGQIPPTAQIETFKGLTEREETLFNALNVLLMSEANAQANLQDIIEGNPKFMDAADDLIEMLSDLKDAVDNKKQTTSKPDYEMIYREFFITHEINLASLSQLESLNPVYLALQKLKPFVELDKRCAQLNHASSEESDVVRRLLQEKQNDPDPFMRKKATLLLVQHQLLNKEEKQTLFLESVVKCEMEIVDLLLQEDPSLLLPQGNVTDYSGREWQNITAAQYVNWAFDTEMFDTLIKHIPLDKEGDKIRAQVKLQTDEADNHGVNYRLNGKDFNEIHYNYKELKDAYTKYLKQFDVAPINWNEVDRYWLLIGTEQAKVPVYVAHRYCNPDESFDPTPKFDKPLRVRSLAFHNYSSGADELWYPLRAAAWSAFGLDFSILRGGRRGHAASGVAEAHLVGALGGRRRAIDSAAVSALFEVKTQELALLKEQELKPRPESGLTASGAV